MLQPLALAIFAGMLELGHMNRTCAHWALPKNNCVQKNHSTIEKPLNQWGRVELSHPIFNQLSQNILKFSTGEDAEVANANLGHDFKADAIPTRSERMQDLHCGGCFGIIRAGQREPPTGAVACGTPHHAKAWLPTRCPTGTISTATGPGWSLAIFLSNSYTFWILFWGPLEPIRKSRSVHKTVSVHQYVVPNACFEASRVFNTTRVLGNMFQIYLAIAPPNKQISNTWKYEWRCRYGEMKLWMANLTRWMSCTTWTYENVSFRKN